MVDNFKFKSRYDVNDLIDIVEVLRSPGGCPWDIEQDHKSIRRDFLEETYEVIEAINKDDKDLLLEELGDVLLLPIAMFKSGEELLLDDLTREDIEKALQVKVNIVKSSGQDFIDAVLMQETTCKESRDGGRYEL